VNSASDTLVPVLEEPVLEDLVLEDHLSHEQNLGKDLTFSVPLTKQNVPVWKGARMIGNKSSYFGSVRVGSNDEVFTAVFDTGSGNVIFPSTGCKSAGCTRHKRYDRKMSLTSADIATEGSVKAGISATVTFGTGSVTAGFVNEQVCIGTQGFGCAQLNIFFSNSHERRPIWLV